MFNKKLLQVALKLTDDFQLPISKYCFALILLNDPIALDMIKGNKEIEESFKNGTNLDNETLDHALKECGNDLEKTFHYLGEDHVQS